MLIRRIVEYRKGESCQVFCSGRHYGGIRPFTDPDEANPGVAQSLLHETECHPRRPRKGEISQETLHAIQANNELDLELYRYAEKLFQEQIGSQSPLFENELQRFRKLNGTYGRLHVLLSVGRRITAAKILAGARLFMRHE